MSYGDFKDLPRRTASDKVLRDKAFNIGGGVKSQNILNQELAEESHKPIVIKFKKKLQSSFIKVNLIKKLVFIMCY